MRSKMLKSCRVRLLAPSAGTRHGSKMHVEMMHPDSKMMSSWMHGADCFRDASGAYRRWQSSNAAVGFTQQSSRTSEESTTPAMRQYWAVKHDPQYRRCVVLFQLGGFYEAFYEDAVVLSRVCDVVLTARGDVPMAGLPVDRAETHLAKLLRRGIKVVLVDQEGQLGPRVNPFVGGSYTRVPSGPGAKSSLISRAVGRVVTPGTAAELLASSHASNHYIAAIALDLPHFAETVAQTQARGGSTRPRGRQGEMVMPAAVAWADVSTGECYVRACDTSALAAELSNVSPVEVLVPSLTPDLTLPPQTSADGRAWTSGIGGMGLGHHGRDSLALEHAMRLVRPEQAKLLHDIHEQRRASHASSGVYGQPGRADGTAPAAPDVLVRPPGRILLPGGDTDGCWLTFLPSHAFGPASSGALLSMLAQQHGLSTSAQAAGVDNTSTTGAALNSLLLIEMSAVGGLLSYIAWAYCGSLPRLSLPTSLTSTGQADGHAWPGAIASGPAAGQGTQGEGDVQLAQRQQPAPTAVEQSIPAPSVSFSSPKRLRLNEASQRALELVKLMHGKRRGRGCLLHLMDISSTHMGGRMIDARLVRPLADLEPLLHRHDAVEVLSGHRLQPGGQLRAALRGADALGAVPDLERCFQRISNQPRAGMNLAAGLARDLVTIRDGLTSTRRVGLMLASGDPLLFAQGQAGKRSRKAHASTDDASHAVHRQAAVTAASTALRCLPEDLPSMLLRSVSTEFDVVWPTANTGVTPSGKKAGGTHVPSDHILSRSYVLAQCAALLTMPLGTVHGGASGHSKAEAQAEDTLHPAFATLAAAHDELCTALIGGRLDAQPSAVADSTNNAVGTDTDTSAGAGGPAPQTASGWLVRHGYSAELDTARARASNTAIMRKELESILKTDLGLPQDSTALKIRGGAAEAFGRGGDRDGLFIEVDVKRAANAQILDVHLAKQSKAMQSKVADSAAVALHGTAGTGASTDRHTDKAFANLKPSDLFLRPIKSTATLKRFRCDALGRLEQEIAEAGARAEALELNVIRALADKVVQAQDALKAIAKAVAVVDVSASLAELADRHSLVRPVLTEVGLPVRTRGVADTGVDPKAVTMDAKDLGSGELMLLSARHLVVEHALAVWHPASEPWGDYEAAAVGSDSPERADDGVDDGIDGAALPATSTDDNDISPRARAPSDHPRHVSFVANDVILGASPTAMGHSSTGLDHHDGRATTGSTAGNGQPSAWSRAMQEAALTSQSPAPNTNPSAVESLASARCMLLLGPNMGGKSTYLRTAAQAVVLAQMGCFVPAAAARMGVIDAIFCRVGASDDLSGHRSTFRVEMEETADILASATARSLVVVDEVGRGTAVADGLALSTAILEELSSIGALSLFATHFHELAAAALPLTVISPQQGMGGQGDAATTSRPARVRAMYMEWITSDGASNGSGDTRHMDPSTAAAPVDGEVMADDDVDEVEPGILATHKVKLHPLHTAMAAGLPAEELIQLLGSSVSHGLSVARHAGLPPSVVRRATTILDKLRDSDLPVAWARAVLDASKT